MDLDRIPDEYLICASYDADLQVCAILLPWDNTASTQLYRLKCEWQTM